MVLVQRREVRVDGWPRRARVHCRERRGLSAVMVDRRCRRTDRRDSRSGQAMDAADLAIWLRRASAAHLRDGAQGRLSSRAAISIRREAATDIGILADRSEEHTSELQSIMRISYAVFCLKKHT